jgi:hypothetical protein
VDGVHEGVAGGVCAHIHTAVDNSKVSSLNEGSKGALNVRPSVCIHRMHLEQHNLQPRKEELKIVIIEKIIIIEERKKRIRLPTSFSWKSL